MPNQGAQGPKPKRVTFGWEGLRKIARGLKTLSRITRKSYGPRRSHVAMTRKLDSPILVSDAYLICKSFELDDPFENIGIRLLQDALSTVNRAAGDGGTTTAILLDEMISRGLQQVSCGADPVLVRRGMQRATEAVVQCLAQRSLGIEDEHAVASLLRTASFNDEISKLIQQAVQAVGRDGIIRVVQSQKIHSELSVHDGVHLERGLVTALLAKDTFNAETRLRNPYIFVTNRRLASQQDVAGILDQIHALDGSLLLIADAIEGDALSTLVRNHLGEIMAIAAIHAPEYGDQRLEVLRDVAALSGGLVFQQELGGAIPSEYFGRADEAVVTKNSTLILRPQRNRGQALLRLEEAQQQMNDERLSQYDRERRQRRVGNLRGKTATINVGAATDVETGELLEKTERLLHAVRTGLQYGFVPGGGAALVAAACQAAAALMVEGDEQLGAAVVFDALAEPARQLLRNAQIDDVLAAQIIHRYGIIDNNMIYDIGRRQWADPYQSGVADSFQAMFSAIQTASSAASVFLNASVVVTDDYPME